METPHLLVDLLLLLAVSIPVVLAFRRLRLPSIAGFLAAGALLGPHALGWIESTHQVEPLAEIGVALLLFTVGLEFSLPRLLLLRRQLLTGGASQVGLTIAAVAGAGLLAGLSWRTAAVVGALASLSSTALVLRTLTDRRETDSPHGLLSIGILLFQDLAVIPLMLAIPLLAGSAPGVGGVLAAAGKAIFGVGAVLLLARYGFSRLAYLVVRQGGRELFVLFVVLTALGAALFTQALGLPLALGTFVAGLVISESEYSHQVVAEILPFRDVFNALFFVSIGMLLDVSVVAREPALVGGLALGLLAVKGTVVFLLARLLTRSRRVAVLVAAALFQIGEFSFVLARQAGSLGLLGDADMQRFLAVAVLTMALTPFAMQAAPALPGRREKEAAGAPDSGTGEAPEAGPVVVIGGYGLNGRNLARVLEAAGIPFRILEMNPDTVRRAGAEGVPIVFGDVSRLEGLEHARLRGAKVLVLAISDPLATRRAVSVARRHAPAIQIVVRTRAMAEMDELARLGADHVIPEEFETSVEIFCRVLRILHVPRGTIAVQAELIRREGYRILREGDEAGPSLDAVRRILAETIVETLFVPAASPVVGRTLGELQFRARTGAFVLAVARRGEAFHTPGPDFRLEPNDFLVLTGDHAQLEQARLVVEGRPLE